MLSVQIRQVVLEELTAHARAESPCECCGLLVGNTSRVESAIRARNLRASPSRYLIDPKDHLSAIRDARSTGYSIVGTYHSHPFSTASPSDTDLREATYTEYLYFIVSPGRGQQPTAETKAYRLVSGSFQSVALVSIP